MADKHLYIISGPNGAGKTTASRSIVATGGRDQETTIKDNKHFKIIEEYVKR